MKRSEALVSLSREHHHALYLAKVISDQAGEGDSAQRFNDFWNREGADHFRIEEEVLLPGSGLSGPDGDPEVARMLADHLQLRRAAKKISSGEATPEELVEAAGLLKAHVRFEERELFPRIEAGLSEEENRQLADEIEAAERNLKPDPDQ